VYYALVEFNEKEMNVKVTKSQAEFYEVRSGKNSLAWGDIVIKCGKQSVSVMATSDYGTFDHYWSHCGGDPKEFLCGLDFQYAMKKLTNHELYIPNPAGYENEIKESIICSRKEDGLTKEQAKTAWVEMLEILEEYEEGDLLFHGLYDHVLFESVFGDYEGLPSSTIPDPRAVDFFNDIWNPFTVYLREEIKQKS